MYSATGLDSFFGLLAHWSVPQTKPPKANPIASARPLRGLACCGLEAVCGVGGFLRDGLGAVLGAGGGVAVAVGAAAAGLV